MDDDKSGSMISETHLLLGVGLFFIYKLYVRFMHWWNIWILNPVHKYSLIATALLVINISLFFGWKKLIKIRERNIKKQGILGKSDDGVYCGVTDDGKWIYVSLRQRLMHCQVIGTTNAGKTESVILLWSIQDISQGRGFLLIDGKADNSLLDKLFAYVVKCGRENDFRLLSLSHPKSSHQFNPLIGGTAEEITERVFNAFEFENPHYRNIQYEVFGQVLRIFEAAKITPTFKRVLQMLTNMPLLEETVQKIPDERLRQWVQRFKALSAGDREERTSGLITAIGQFSEGRAGELFNCETGSINLDEALSENQIVYVQLPVLLSPFLGKAAGKLILQSLQSAIANRHRSKNKEKKFFSVFLDDFAEYLYPGFVSILNKSRSANVGIVFAHQALGDIQTLGEPIANTILTNSNLKIFMRGNDPDSAEYFSKVIGTAGTTKVTERQSKTLLSYKKTGEQSVREVEEFLVHPNVFKRELGVGQAMMIVPHDDGSELVKINFHMIPTIKTHVPIPNVEKTSAPDLVFTKTEDSKAEPTEAIAQAAVTHQSKETEKCT
jgi:type IV secretory pathway TraG/TraD family ATPase VirD4